LTGLTECLGSPIYMAPELIAKHNYGAAVDIWAAGVLLHMLITGEPPFYADDRKELFARIEARDVKLNQPAWAIVSPECKDIVSQMLTKDQYKRPTAEKLLQHKWFKIIKEHAPSSEKMIGLTANLQ
jgi:serine/threonine protein kinase